MTKLISALSLLIATPAFAFTLNSTTSSNFKGWSNANIKFRLNPANCPPSVDVRGIFKDAIDVWNNVHTSRVTLSLESDTTSSTFGDPITVICDTNYAGGDVSVQNSSPGYAQVQPSTGDYITTGLMSLNASAGNANIANLSRDIVAVTLAHEIGHLIGIGHSQSTPALMYYNVGPKTRLALSQDDIDAVSYLYPRDELGDGMLGCGRIHSPTPPSGMTILITMFLLMLPLAVLIRQKWLQLTRRPSSI